jgi:HAD superfamily hydrolase (TIGR01484 family)
MKNINEFPAEVAAELHYALFDIDDTITTEGRLGADAYNALWAMHERGLRVIPVTGRPAGWCDMIIRQWPVDAVIGENGAFAYYRVAQGTPYAELTHPNVCPDAQTRLKAVRDVCLAQVHGCRVALDQFARKYDLAIDFCEDEPKLELSEAYKIRDICESFGALAKVSSIHVNTWFGEYDKREMAEMLLTQIYGELPPTADAPSFLDKSIFFGDSPNDEPMFAYFPHSCAVANILPFLDKLENKPAYICSHESGRGFAQAIGSLLTKMPAFGGIRS